LADLIGCSAVPVARLTEIFRQTAASQIIVNAHRVNRGAMPGLATPELSGC
jgi:exodeoxyribonuclease V alpha subunit